MVVIALLTSVAIVVICISCYELNKRMLNNHNRID